MEPNRRYYICDVFSNHPFGGNPLAVFPNAVGLNSAQMRLIARELNLPRTAFVFPSVSEQGTHRLRTFTPTSERPLGFNAAIGAAQTLVWLGDVPPIRGSTIRFAFEDGMGPLQVSIPISLQNRAVASAYTARLPRLSGNVPPLHWIADSLSLSASDLAQGSEAPRVFDCGLSCLFVAVRDLESIRRISFREDRLGQSHANRPTLCICAYTRETVDGESDIHCRFFAPGLGVTEEPASGASALGLASCLADRNPRENVQLYWVIEQGFELGRPSRVFVQAEKRQGLIRKIRLGGESAYVGQGEIQTEPFAFPIQQVAEDCDVTGASDELRTVATA